MKKIISIFFVFILLILSGCSNNNNELENKISKLELEVIKLNNLSNNTEELDKAVNKINELENEIKELSNIKTDNNDFFSKKQECSKLTNILIERTKQIEDQYSSLGKMSFEQVFYSPKYNNCLWVRITRKESGEIEYITHKALYEYGDDSGSSRALDGCDEYPIKYRQESNCDEFDEKIEELKKE